jgi:hypothetical protein
MRRAGSPTTRGHPDASRAVHSRYGLLILPILCIGIVDAVWSRHIGLTINGWTWFATAVAFCVLVSVVYRKLRPAPPIARLASYAALWIVFTAVGCIFTYLAASVSRPLIDGYLTSFDHYLGFDWISWSNGVHRYMLLTVILRAAYDSLGLQIVASIVILSSGTGPDRNAELLLGAILSLVLVALISALWPTLGPWTPLSDQYASSDDLLIARDVLTMRAGGSTSFALAGHRDVSFVSHRPGHSVCLCASGSLVVPCLPCHQLSDDHLDSFRGRTLSLGRVGWSGLGRRRDSLRTPDTSA